MVTNWLDNFIKSLERILDKPPYLIFFFSGSLLVMISLIMKSNFEKVWPFFIYAVAGTIIRYIERDFMSTIGKIEDPKNPHIPRFPNAKIWIISVYHTLNIGLLVGLLLYLIY